MQMLSRSNKTTNVRAALQAGRTTEVPLIADVTGFHLSKSLKRRGLLTDPQGRGNAARALERLEAEGKVHQQIPTSL